jgi:hypothetical protein
MVGAVPLKLSHDWLAVSLSKFDKLLKGGASFIRNAKDTWEKDMQQKIYKRLGETP